MILTILIGKVQNLPSGIISAKLENGYLENHPATGSAHLKIKPAPGQKRPLFS